MGASGVMSLFAKLMGRGNATGPAWIEAEELSARLAAGPASLVVDVRGVDEFTGPLGHIQGATNVPLPELSAHVETLRRQDKKLVLVCKTDRRSAAAAAQLQAAGVADVAVLRGGMERWRMLGLP